MKKIIVSIVLVFSLCLGLAGCGNGKQEGDFGDSHNYKLAYSDEFDGKELDTSVWAPYEYDSSVHARRGGYWSPDQVRIEKDNLVIETGYVDDPEHPGYHAGVASWPTMRTTYGYYEVKAKIQNTRGVWSAVWLQGDTMGEADGSARDGAEIDIFESAVPYRWQTNMHYDAYKKRNTNSTYFDKLYDGYHIYALDWKKDSMRFYIDGQLYQEITDPNMVPQIPVSMRLSTEIAGKTDENGKPKPTGSVWIGCGSITDNKAWKLPSKFMVDYVRIYDNGDLVLTK